MTMPDDDGRTVRSTVALLQEIASSTQFNIDWPVAARHILHDLQHVGEPQKLLLGKPPDSTEQVVFSASTRDAEFGTGESKALLTDSEVIAAHGAKLALDKAASRAFLQRAGILDSSCNLAADYR